MFDGCQVFDTCVYMHVGCLMPVCMGVRWLMQVRVFGCQVSDAGVYRCLVFDTCVCVCVAIRCLLQMCLGVRCLI